MTDEFVNFILSIKKFLIFFLLLLLDRNTLEEE